MVSNRSQNLQGILVQAGITYPRVVNLSGKSLRDRINKIIRNTAYQAVPTYNPGTSIIEARSGYTTPLNMNGVLSLRFEDYYYPEMAAHGVTGVSSATLDLENGHVFTFQELFLRGANYQNRLNQLIQAQISANQIPMLTPYAGVGADESYYLTPDSLVVYYQPYVYTPGYYGVLEFKIPYSQIMDIIDPRGPIGRVLF